MNLEKLILQTYVEVIKSIGGRGPKNIFVKISGQLVEIHFMLVKSALEVFIQNHFESPEEYLESMYMEIHDCTKEAVLTGISKKTGIQMLYRDFIINVNQDKFCLILEMQEAVIKP